MRETAAFFAKAHAAEGARCRRGCGFGWCRDHGGGSRRAVRRAAAAASDTVRDVLMAHIPEFGSARNPCDVTAQILANPESLNACADALLGDPSYGALVVPQTYGYAPLGEAHPGLRFAGGEARQDRLHRLADASGWKVRA